MNRPSGGISPLILILVALIGFGGLLALNARPVEPVQLIVPTQPAPTQTVNPWQAVLEAGFGQQGTLVPTIPPVSSFAAPTFVYEGGVSAPIAAADVASVPTLAIASGATPTRPLPTAQLLATNIPLTAQVVNLPTQVWQPPPLVPPISRDPLGRDHYYFGRPVDSNATNFGIFNYNYGSDGPQDAWRVHAGIDMPNTIGQTVRAAGSGTIEWAADGLRVEGATFQNTSSYGNVVVIRHDFGYEGHPLFTLYAHLSAVLVLPGQRVERGEPIGLVGNSGRVTGPHVHFEVRMCPTELCEDIPGYGETYNPLLWTVPYVGHGVIAGRLVDGFGDLVDDADITVRNWARGTVEGTTTTYIFQNTGVDVNSDPNWQENFVLPDVPAGRYEVIANINGVRLSQFVDVSEGMTSFVELAPQPGVTFPQDAPAPTPEPTAEDAESGEG
ncbi:MAG: M23 family metallopeptidase [Anaerolineae bacterium]|nr:M23 family metallopeptidase [Anaerolineae bacterium]